MINSEFRLLCESLGFYSSKYIIDYLKRFAGNENIKDRPIDYWLKGKSNCVDPIPVDVERLFINLQSKQFEIVKRERDSLVQNKPISFKYVFKDPSKMWLLYPELEGLPVTFLNQIMIRLGISLDYFENNEGA